jgi:SAM-dependent methyltransferase
MIMKNIKEFYNNIPFNQYGSVKKEYKATIDMNPTEVVKILNNINYSNKILEIGSGSGWLLNGLGYHHGAFGIGIDINSLAVDMSNIVSNKLKNKTKFYEYDIFDFVNTDNKFMNIISFGVLHHTKDCKEAIRLIIENLLEKNGTIILGLYNKNERQPFLNYINRLKNNNYSTKELFKKYKKLKHRNFNDTDRHLIKSMFYDQVLNPHETQYSFVEIKELLESLNCTIIETSINNYMPIIGNEDWDALEKELFYLACEDIGNSILNTGLFTIKAIKN